VIINVVFCRCLDMLIGVLTSKHSFSPVFYNKMFDQIRQSRDALKPHSFSTSMVDMCLSLLMFSQNVKALNSFHAL